MTSKGIVVSETHEQLGRACFRTFVPAERSDLWVIVPEDFYTDSLAIETRLTPELYSGGEYRYMLYRASDEYHFSVLCRLASLSQVSGLLVGEGCESEVKLTDMLEQMWGCQAEFSRCVDKPESLIDLLVKQLDDRRFVYMNGFGIPTYKTVFASYDFGLVSRYEENLRDIGGGLV
ncbi:MAG: hypothetical protein AAF561_08740 [Planctomycetota bacterium]